MPQQLLLLLLLCQQTKPCAAVIDGAGISQVTHTFGFKKLEQQQQPLLLRSQTKSNECNMVQKMLRDDDAGLLLLECAALTD